AWILPVFDWNLSRHERRICYAPAARKVTRGGQGAHPCSFGADGRFTSLYAPSLGLIEASNRVRLRRLGSRPSARSAPPHRQPEIQSPGGSLAKLLPAALPGNLPTRPARSSSSRRTQVSGAVVECPSVSARRAGTATRGYP